LSFQIVIKVNKFINFKMSSASDDEFRKSLIRLTLKLMKRDRVKDESNGNLSMKGFKILGKGKDLFVYIYQTDEEGSRQGGS
jgi:hypothetical protein